MLIFLLLVTAGDASLGPLLPPTAEELPMVDFLLANCFTGVEGASGETIGAGRRGATTGESTLETSLVGVEGGRVD